MQKGGKWREGPGGRAHRTFIQEARSSRFPLENQAPPVSFLNQSASSPVPKHDQTATDVFLNVATLFLGLNLSRRRQCVVAKALGKGYLLARAEYDANGAGPRGAV